MTRNGTQSDYQAHVEMLKGSVFLVMLLCVYAKQHMFV